MSPLPASLRDLPPDHPVARAFAALPAEAMLATVRVRRQGRWSWHITVDHGAGDVTDHMAYGPRRWAAWRARRLAAWAARLSGIDGDMFTVDL